MAHLTMTAANGSRWSVREEAHDGYGRPVPAGRECWAFRIEGEPPHHLRAVAGFYASSIQEVRKRLDG